MLRRFLIAMVQPLNLLVAGVILAVAAYTNSGWVLLGGILAYMIFAIQRFKDEGFNKKLTLGETYSEIIKLDYRCEKLAENAKNSTNSDKRFRVREVLKDKNDIINAFKNDKENLLKQKIAKQSIELVTVYINLIENYYLRLKDVEKINIGEVKQRIQNNSEKITNSENIEIKEDIKNTVELDKKLLERMEEEKGELDRAGAKLTYIESSINLFKQQMLSSLDQDISQKVETVINEATALDNVLTQRKKERV